MHKLFTIYFELSPEEDMVDQEVWSSRALGHQLSCSVVSDSLPPHESQHARPPCPSPTPGVYPNSCPSSRWCHPAISSSVFPFSSCLQSLPALGSFPVSQLYAWGGQSIGVSTSASILPMNTQDWSPLGWTGWISLQSKRFHLIFQMSLLRYTPSLALGILLKYCGAAELFDVLWLVDI